MRFLKAGMGEKQNDIQVIIMEGEKQNDIQVIYIMEMVHPVALVQLPENL